MISVDEARELAQKKLRTKLSKWATREIATETAEGGDAVEDENGLDSNDRTERTTLWAIPLKPPSERTVLANQVGVEGWVSQWRSCEAPTGVSVDWEDRSWRSIGRQSIPTRIAFTSADAVARFAGGAPARQWHLLTGRVAALRDRFDDSPALGAAIRRNTAALLAYDSSTYSQFLDVVSWLVENPTIGYRPRQLPIRGVDSKWFGTHRGTATSFYEAITCGSELGIVSSDTVIRVRILDPLLTTRGPYDFAAPAPELAQLDLV